MKFSIILFCILPAFLTSYAAVSKKYYRDDFHNHFISYVEPNYFNSLSGKNQTVESVGKLTTSLLYDIYLRTGKDFNIVLSPVSIWATLAILLEGAGGKTENELKTKLRLSYNTPEEGKQILRNRYKELLSFYQAGNSPTEFKAINFAVSEKTKMINPEFKNILRQYYNGKFFEIDRRDGFQSVNSINMWASQMTQNRIPSLVTPAMLNNLLLVIGNAVYFKSKWKHPFDPKMTTLMPFKDEYERTLRKVPMMNQVVVLPYTYNTQLESEMLEIPYADGLTSMIVILPQEGARIGSVLAKMSHMSLDKIIPNNFVEETIQLSLPRFQIVNKLHLNDVLKQDLPSVFSPQYAEFPKIARNIFVSKMSHTAEIENTEEGTTASAVTSVQFAYKTSSLVFRANRPFIYLINDMKTKTVLFAGTYSSPFVV